MIGLGHDFVGTFQDSLSPPQLNRSHTFEILSMKLVDVIEFINVSATRQGTVKSRFYEFSFLCQGVLARMFNCCGGAVALVVAAFTQLHGSGSTDSWRPCLSQSEKYCRFMGQEKETKLLLQIQHFYRSPLVVKSNNV